MLFLAAFAQAVAEPAKPSLPYPAANIINCSVADEASSLLCRALDASRQDRFADSAELFERAAGSFTAGQASRRDEALAAAGNMWIAAGQPGKATAALDKAVAGGGLTGVQLGQAHIDRARAAEAQGDLKTARARLSEASKTVGQDPYLWYFAAALAMREGDIPAAKSTIGRALSTVPNSPELLFEAGHIAQESGEEAVARDYWEKAMKADPNGPIGKAAREALAMTNAPLTVTNDVAKLPNGDGEEGRQN
jgi:tetratricopeptide (TPR) repeat protein